MKIIIDADMEVKTTNIETALNKFFKKYKELEYWKDTFHYMEENDIDFFSDDTLADGTENHNWKYALHLDINENSIYMAVVERGVKRKSL